MDSHSKVIERAEMMIKCMRIARELIEARIALRDRIRSSEFSFFGNCVVIDDAAIIEVLAQIGITFSDAPVAQDEDCDEPSKPRRKNSRTTLLERIVQDSVKAQESAEQAKLHHQDQALDVISRIESRLDAMQDIVDGMEE